jgi:hypothetical protein
MKYKVLFFVAVISMMATNAQESKQEIDPSKPTNLYTQFNVLAEVNSGEKFNTYGTRLNFQYAFNSDNLLLLEVPLLYNDATESFGLSDTRVRYFHALKRNITKRLIAIAPYADITIPTGSLKKGLGNDVWSLAAGVVAGYVVSPKISMFPGVGLVHITAPDAGKSQTGVSFQTNMSVSFSKKAFLFINPIVTILAKTNWQAELNYNYIVTPNKFKVNAGWIPNFTNDINTFRVGATFFL